MPRGYRRSIAEALGPDRNRLYDLVKLTWDEAQTEDEETQPVTAERIAEGGSYSVEQIIEHLLAEQDDTYVLERDADGVRVLAVQ